MLERVCVISGWGGGRALAALGKAAGGGKKERETLHFAGRAPGPGTVGRLLTVEKSKE